MTVVRRSVLFTVGRADAAVHVENDHLRRATIMNTVDPRPVLAGAAVVENIPGRIGQAKGIVKLPIGEQTGIRGDLGTVELKLEPTVADSGGRWINGRSGAGHR